VSKRPQLAAAETLYETNVADIAAMLRQCADSIDEGANPKSIVAVATEEDGSISIYGWGRTDSIETLATLQLAILKLGRTMIDDDA
jgi:hypothetical protein